MSSCLDACTFWIVTYFAAFESTLETTAEYDGRPFVPALHNQKGM
jgi:hypothetical protein